MPQKTVLQLTQDVLSSINSDSVNSINDTQEALQVVSILETTFFDLLGNTRWPHLKTLIQLEAANVSRPTHMKMSVDLQEIEWIKYNRRDSDDTKDKFETVMYLEPEDFLDKIMLRDSSTANVQSVTDVNGATMLILNDVAPTYWTTYDDDYIVFDSFDSAVDTFLQASKSITQAYQEPVFTKLDGFVPDLPAKVYPKYLAEVTSTAWLELKQTQNAKQEQRSRRQSVYLARNNRRAAGGSRYPSSGRPTRR